MPRRPGPHLIKPGSKAWVAGVETLATWCGIHVERDDTSNVKDVRCTKCLHFYRQKEKQS